MVARDERARRLPGWARWLLGVGGVALLVVVIFAVWFAASMSGGLDNLLDFRHPAPGDRRVVRAGDAALKGAAATGEELAAAMSAADLGAPIGTTQTTGCVRGQHNFKIDDDYDLRCDARHVVAFQPPAVSLTQQVSDVSSALAADGWHRDVRAVPGRDDGVDLSVGGTEVAAYTRGDERLILRAVGPAGFFQGDTRFRDLPALRTSDGLEVPVAELPGRAPPGHYTLLVELTQPYFEE